MADISVEPEWPNERLKILIPTWSLLIISNLFVLWRVVYGFMKGRGFMLSDYLLILAAVSLMSQNRISRTDDDRCSTRLHPPLVILWWILDLGDTSWIHLFYLRLNGTHTSSGSHRSSTSLLLRVSSGQSVHGCWSSTFRKYIRLSFGFPS